MKTQIIAVLHTNHGKAVITEGSWGIIVAGRVIYDLLPVQ